MYLSFPTGRWVFHCTIGTVRVFGWSISYSKIASFGCVQGYTSPSGSRWSPYRIMMCSYVAGFIHYNCQVRAAVNTSAVFYVSIDVRKLAETALILRIKLTRTDKSTVSQVENPTGHKSRDLSSDSQGRCHLQPHLLEPHHSHRIVRVHN